MKYYISRAGQQYGPYSLEDLRNMQAQHQVDVNDLAWAEGMPAWTPLSQVLGSTPAPAAAPVAAPYTPAPRRSISHHNIRRKRKPRRRLTRLPPIIPAMRRNR